MKKRLILFSLMLTGLSFGHEAVTIGPNGGRVIYVDSTTTPNVEVLVNADGRASIWLLDKDRKPIAPGQQSISVTGGPRTEAKKLDTEVKDGKFLTAKLPDGAPYFLIIQLKETPDAKAATLRLNYDTGLTASGKPAYLDDSVNAASGDNIAIPSTAKGTWAELNQHQNELVEGFAEKKYEALDEVTRAYPKLAKGLVDQSGEKAPQAGPLVDTLIKHLGTVREANAARTLDAGKTALDGVAATLAELKKLYPEDVANAQLAE